jgi:pimeloyl-ACP methyl ester carboxylesterase
VRMARIESAGVPLHVADSGGGGQPVILLHGGGRSLGDWDAVRPLLTSLGYRVVAVDLRGHGATPAAPWTWELAPLQDVAAVITGRQLHRPAVVGHSLGGMIAALWATRHPECPLAVNLDGHGNPTRPDQYVGLDPRTAADQQARVRDVLEGMRGSLDGQMREVMAAIDALELAQTYRSTLCPLLVTRGTRSMAELLPEAAQPGWRAYEAWVRQALLDAATTTVQLDVE